MSADAPRNPARQYPGAKPGYRADGNCRACMVEIEGERTHNKVSLTLYNEVGIPVSYQIYKGKKKIEGGRGASMDFEQTDESLDSYYVIYSFNWNGENYILEKGVHIKEKQLTVDVDQPEKVFPGARVPITVKVTEIDQQGRVNLSRKATLTSQVSAQS